jgi:hypothetical protein
MPHRLRCELHLLDTSGSEKSPRRTERSARQEAINGVIGELVKLINQKEAYELLLEKVQVLDHYLQRLFASGHKR